MKQYDLIFEHFNELFERKLNSQYDAYNIQFDCLKASIDHFEGKHGRLSDYGLKYIAHFARACEISSHETIKERINASLLKI